MTPPARTSSLEVLNRSQFPVQLRFYCEKRLIWDVWLISGAEMSVPDPVRAEIDLKVLFIEPASRVAYRINTRICPVRQRLVTRMLAEAGSVRFDLDIEPGSQVGDIELLNLCAGQVRFEAHYLHSPFIMTSVLDASASGTLNFKGIEVAAIMGGITTTRLAIKDWHSELLIDSETLQHNGLPILSLIPRTQQ